MTQQVDITQLQTISLFTQLDVSVLEQLVQHCRVRSYTSDQVVFYEGDQLPACLYVLISGRLRIAKVTVSGKETILRLLPAGEIFAAPAVFGNGKAPATVTAIEPARVLTLKKQALLDEFAQTPDLALQLLGVFNQRLQQLHNQVHGLVSERAIVRLIHYLEYVANHVGTEGVEGSEQIKERLTYYQIARSIGITYEECVRLFKQLQPAVRYRRGGKIVITDRRLLEQQR